MPVAAERVLAEIRCATHVYPVLASPTVADAVATTVTDETIGLVDRAVHDLFPEAFEALAGAGRLVLVEANEATKSYREAGLVIERLLEIGVRKSTRLLVVGGGTVQDTGGYAASILMRGIGWSLVSTTLLGQCDSCIGSKSSINVGPWKNQVGTFWAPLRVVLPDEALTTLERDDIRSGLGEAIKLHLLEGESHWSWLEARLAGLEQDRRDGLGEIVRSSIAIKKRYIEEDEYDRGVRNLLNYGHTFGHAFEALTAHGIPHGIAVTLGMLAATSVSAGRDWVDAAALEQLFDALRPWYAPYQTQLLALPERAVVDAMKRDKKATRSALVCILTRGPGAMEIVRVEDPDEIAAGLARFKRHLGDPHVAAPFANH